MLNMQKQLFVILILSLLVILGCEKGIIKTGHAPGGSPSVQSTESPDPTPECNYDPVHPETRDYCEGGADGDVFRQTCIPGGTWGSGEPFETCFYGCESGSCKPAPASSPSATPLETPTSTPTATPTWYDCQEGDTPCDFNGDGTPGQGECCIGRTPYCELARTWNKETSTCESGTKEICTMCTDDDQCISPGLPSESVYWKCCKQTGINRCYDSRKESCCGNLDSNDNCESDSANCRRLDTTGEDMCCSEPCTKCDGAKYSFCDDYTRPKMDIWKDFYAPDYPHHFLDGEFTKETFSQGSGNRRCFLDLNSIISSMLAYVEDPPEIQIETICGGSIKPATGTNCVMPGDGQGLVYQMEDKNNIVRKWEITAPQVIPIMYGLDPYSSGTESWIDDYTTPYMVKPQSQSIEIQRNLDLLGLGDHLVLGATTVSSLKPVSQPTSLILGWIVNGMYQEYGIDADSRREQYPAGNAVTARLGPETTIHIPVNVYEAKGGFGWHLTTDETETDINLLAKYVHKYCPDGPEDMPTQTWLASCESETIWRTNDGSKVTLGWFVDIPVTGASGSEMQEARGGINLKIEK